MNGAANLTAMARVLAYDFARDMLRAWPEHTAMIVLELIDRFDGRHWSVGYPFCASANYYIEVLGVYSWADRDDEDGARECLRRWIANAREAIRRDRVQANAK